MSKTKLRAIPLWILQALLALMFLHAGGRKLVPGSPWPGMFSHWGYPDHFYLVIGVIEILGAVALLVPRLACYAASLLAVVMIGALATHLLHGERQAIVTAVVFVLLLVVAWFRRPGFLRRRQKATTLAVLALAIALPGGAQQEKPAEQVYKNIQVLKGVPADQRRELRS